jgi:hypothetical protein
VRWSVAIFVSAFAFYMATSSREPAWGDARGMWDVANHLLEGEYHAKAPWPEDMPARDGKFYGITPIGTSIVHVPGAALAKLGHAIAPSHDALVRPLAVHLGPALLGALACAVFFGLLRDLGCRARIASAATVILACATTTWVYARMPYSEIAQLTCFLAMFRGLVRVLDTSERLRATPPPSGVPLRRDAIWFGVWAGCLVNLKYVFAVAVLGAAVAIVWRLRSRRAVLVEAAKWATIGGAPFALLALAYNHARWGSPLETGYGPYLDAFFGGSPFDGAWGMLLSPNKSVLLYSPPLVLAVLAAPRAIRAAPRYGVAVLATVLPVFLVYCTYRSWSGDYAWGPRFLVWAVPVLLVPIAWWIDPRPEVGQIDPRPEAGRVRRIVLAAVVAGGIAVQVLGSALYWDHFVRIAIDAKNQWLGQPNRRGAYIAERGRGHCDSCFEDTYEVMWTPAFHPIRGHWWLVKSIARGDDARSAQADAPWRHYTTLEMNLAANYPRARIDWWGLLWIKDAPKTFTLGLVLLIVFVGALAYGVWRWLQLHRTGDT